MRLEQVIFKDVVNRAVLRYVELYHSATTGPGNILASRPRTAYERQHFRMPGQEVYSP